MYQFYEIGREHHRELLREAENARRARRSREEERPSRSSPAGEGRRVARLQEVLASWGGTNVPFFKA